MTTYHGVDETAEQRIALALFMLRNSDSAVRAAGALHLGVLGSSAVRTVPALVAALDDHNAWVREEAAWALGEICGAATTLPAP